MTIPRLEATEDLSIKSNNCDPAIFNNSVTPVSPRRIEEIKKTEKQIDKIIRTDPVKTRRHTI